MFRPASATPLSPVHNNEYFAKYAKTLEEMGADSICIKDMAGLLKPPHLRRAGERAEEDSQHPC